MTEEAYSTKKGIDVVRRVRKFSRNNINLPTRVEVLLHSGEIFTTGTAILKDISFKGARLGNFDLKKMYFPCAPFKLFLHFRSPEYEGIEATAIPVRFGQGKEFELGIEFDEITVTESKESKTEKKTNTHRREHKS